METLILQGNEDLTYAGEVLKNGGLVAFPTETVYGLGGNALDARASEKIYKAKGRPSDNPLIVHIADRSALPAIVKAVPSKAEALMDAFWPGPLTLIMEKSDLVPSQTTGGLGTVAVRFPSNEIAQELILKGGGYVAAPSANLSGKPSTTSAEHVIHDLKGNVDVIIDGGNSVLGLESTIIDCTVDPPMILRPGYVTREMAEKIVGTVLVDRAILKADAKEAPKAPGMKYKHYAPKAQLILLKGEPEAVKERLEELSKDPEVGILPMEDVAAMAGEFYDRLRKFDETNVRKIYAAAYDESGLGAALMNRMLKASGYTIEEVEK